MHPRQATALVALACLLVAGLGESVTADYGNAAVIPGVGDELLESAPLLTLSSPQFPSKPAKSSVPAKTPCPPTSPETIRQPTSTTPGYGTTDPQEHETSHADNEHYQLTKHSEKEDTPYQLKPNAPATAGRPSRGGHESGRFNDEGRDNQHHHRQPTRTEDNRNYAKTDLPEKEDTPYQPKPNAPATAGRPSRGGHESGRFNDEGRDNQHHHRQPTRTEDNRNYAKTDLPEKEDTPYQPKPNAPATAGRPSRGGHESGRFNDEGRDNQHHHRQPARTEDNRNYAKTDLPEKEDTPYQPKPNAPATAGRPSRGGHESGRFNDEGRDNQHHHRQPARTEDIRNYAKTDLPEKEDTPYQPKPNAPATAGRPSRGGHESGRFNGNGNGPNPGGDKKFVKTEYAPKHDQKPEDKKKVGPLHRDQPKPQLRSAGGGAAYSTP